MTPPVTAPGPFAHLFPPVDPADVITRHVGAMFGEIHGRTEVGRTVQSVDEALHNGASEQLEI